MGVQLSRTPYGAFAVKIFQAVRIPLAVASAAGAALVQVASARSSYMGPVNLLVAVLLGGAFVWLLWRSSFVVEESIMIFHSLGIQMVARSYSGTCQNRFVPVDCITAAVINEAVTPEGCYFYLAILMQGHDHLLLAFQCLVIDIPEKSQLASKVPCHEHTTLVFDVKTLKPPLEILIEVRRAVNNALVTDRGDDEIIEN